MSYFIVESRVFYVTYGRRRGQFLKTVPLDRPVLAVSINSLVDARGRVRLREIERAAKLLTKLYERLLPLKPWPPEATPRK